MFRRKIFDIHSERKFHLLVRRSIPFLARWTAAQRNSFPETGSIRPRELPLPSLFSFLLSPKQATFSQLRHTHTHTHISVFCTIQRYNIRVQSNANFFRSKEGGWDRVDRSLESGWLVFMKKDRKKKKNEARSAFEGKMERPTLILLCVRTGEVQFSLTEQRNLVSVTEC